MEYINQNLVHENYKYISPKSAIVVDVNETNVGEIISRVLFQTGYVICVDFSSKKNKTVGVVSVTDVKKYLSKYSELSRGGVEDLINRSFTYTTMESLENDIIKLKNLSFLPVLDEDGALIFTLDQNSCTKWLFAQEFELSWWDDYYKKHLSHGGMLDKTRLLDGMLLPEKYIAILRKLANDNSRHTFIEVGAGPALGYMTSVSSANRRIIIEPLCEKYKQLRIDNNYRIDNEIGIEYYPVGGDIYIPELKESADVLFVMNMLDHTPEWPFVLGNISAYIKQGGYIYLSNDIDHHADVVKGHFNITYNPEKLLLLIKQLGFEIIWKQYWARPDPKACTWISCFAKKI